MYRDVERKRDNALMVWQLLIQHIQRGTEKQDGKTTLVWFPVMDKAILQCKYTTSSVGYK